MRLNGLQVYTPFLVIQYTFVGREASFSCSRGKETLVQEPGNGEKTLGPHEWNPSSRDPIGRTGAVLLLKMMQFT